jgi:type I restriction-modification system DNA methylase subunit
VDVALRALRSKGRAVLHLPLSWASRGGINQRYRDHLLDAANVVALIGLPPGSYVGAMVPSLLLVIDKTAGTRETFVAQLAEDWPNQLNEGGAALEDFYSRTAGR